MHVRFPGFDGRVEARQAEFAIYFSKLNGSQFP
jgi:hypothetical protein